MTMVSSGPYNKAAERKPFDKNVLSGPNVSSYQDNYNKFQPKATPMSVPGYKMPETNRWQNSYKKMETNSHPDFKPVYGPQDNKRPFNMLDLYKEKKKEDKQKEDETKAQKDKETKEKKQLSPKREPIQKKEESYKNQLTPKKEPKPKSELESAKKQLTPKKEPAPKEKLESPKRQLTPKREPLPKKGTVLKKEEETLRKQADTPTRIRNSFDEINESPKRQKQSPGQTPIKQKNKVQPRTEKTKSPARTQKSDLHKADIQSRKPFDKNALTGPNVKSYGNDYDKKFQVKSNNMSMPEYKMVKTSKWQKAYSTMNSNSHPDFKPIYGPQNFNRDLMDMYKENKGKGKKSTEPEEKKSDKKVDKVQPDKMTEKDNEKNRDKQLPRKEEKKRESPRRESKESLKRQDINKNNDTPRRTDIKQDKNNVGDDDDYYGYRKKPENKVVRTDNKKKPILSDDKKEDNKKENLNNKTGQKNDPDDKRQREENEKNKKLAPYNNRKIDDPDRENKPKEVKPLPRNTKEATRKDDTDNNKEVPRKDREKEKKPEEDRNLYTSREHGRPAKPQNNNMSVVRDGPSQKQEKKAKPTAKVAPTTRDEWKKAATDRYETRGSYDKSVRSRFYGKADMDDVLQEKIATQLRQNGIAETKVVPLSAKITQAVLDDVIDDNNTVSPQVTANLADVVNKHLDPILFNKPNKTDLRDEKKSNDVNHLSNLVLLRIGQVHEEIELCKASVDDSRNKKGKANTPRSEAQDRSMIMAIKDGIEQQKTEKDILTDKLYQAQRDVQDVEDDIQKRRGQIEQKPKKYLDADNWQLKQDLTDAEQSKHGLLSKMKEQERSYNSLERQTNEIRQENARLKSRVNETEGQNQGLSGELAKLLSENAKLKVLTSQKEKEIIHLRDPDKDMVHRIRILSDEVTLLRTQTRRLNEEKALLKSRSQRMESGLEESNKHKNKLLAERDNLQKENGDLRQKYRKLALSNPQQKTLPEITSSRNNQTTPRTSSREPSRNLYNSDDRRMSPAQEEDEDDDYDR